MSRGIDHRSTDVVILFDDRNSEDGLHNSMRRLPMVWTLIGSHPSFKDGDPLSVSRGPDQPLKAAFASLFVYDFDQP